MQIKTFEHANENIRTCKWKHSNMQMQYVLFDSTFQGSELLLENNKSLRMLTITIVSYWS